MLFCRVGFSAAPWLLSLQYLRCCLLVLWGWVIGYAFDFDFAVLGMLSSCFVGFGFRLCGTCDDGSGALDRARNVGTPIFDLPPSPTGHQGWWVGWIRTKFMFRVRYRSRRAYAEEHAKPLKNLESWRRSGRDDRKTMDVEMCGTTIELCLRTRRTREVGVQMNDAATAMSGILVNLI